MAVQGLRSSTKHVVCTFLCQNPLSCKLLILYSLQNASGQQARQEHAGGPRPVLLPPTGNCYDADTHTPERDTLSYGSRQHRIRAPAPSWTPPQTLTWAHLGQPVGLRGAGRRGVEGLEVDAAEGDNHPPWLAAQGGDAGAHTLKEDAFLVILQPPRVEALMVLVLLAGQMTVWEGTQIVCNLAGQRWHKRLASSRQGRRSTETSCLCLPLLLGRTVGGVHREPGEMQLSMPAAACGPWPRKFDQASLPCLLQAATLYCTL